MRGLFAILLIVANISLALASSDTRHPTNTEYPEFYSYSKDTLVDNIITSEAQVC